MHDIRMVLPAAAAWLTAAYVVDSTLTIALVVVAVSIMAAATILYAARSRGLARMTVLILLVTGFVAGLAGLRTAALDSGPAHELASERAVVKVAATVTRDSHRVSSQLAVFEVTARRISARGETFSVRAPMTVFAHGLTARLPVGARLQIVGRLSPPEDSDSAATINASRLQRMTGTDWWWTAADKVRAGVVESVSLAGDRAAALIPALVQGDDSALTVRMREDFRRSGLTHLLAVSGTNLTIVLFTVLLIGQLCGVRGRGQWVLGFASVIGFVLLARPDPSVLRAAAMGAVALSALGYGQRGGMRTLALAVIGLLLFDPWLSHSLGFGLSVCATAGILIFAPRWSAILARWMPRWAAIAIAVPTAAQLACTPLIAAISSSISLVAVFANLAAGPAVAPATVLGLGGGIVALVAPGLAHVIGLGAALFGQWIILVAQQAASLPGASIGWSHPLWVLIVLCLILACLLPWLLRKPWLIAGIALALIVGFVRPPDRGWPPEHWVMVACDVGQGDATVLKAGPGSAVVVDAGPDPRLVDGCLDRLHVSKVPLLVFTHDHADHVDGWPGVFEGRSVGVIGFGPTGGPVPDGVGSRLLVAGDSIAVGALQLNVLAPVAGYVVRGEDGSAVNNASIVILAHTRGAALLLAGDIEPEAQETLMSRLGPIHADVLKMPHHGSSRQDEEFIAGVGAAFATVSAGAGNDYGHPAASALALLRSVGTKPLRTDTQGDIAIVVDEGRIWAETR